MELNSAELALIGELLAGLAFPVNCISSSVVNHPKSALMRCKAVIRVTAQHDEILVQKADLVNHCSLYCQNGSCQGNCPGYLLRCRLILRESPVFVTEKL
jgi:hypothetical protein